MVEVLISFTPIWYTEETDMSNCTGCGDKIYSKMYRAMLQIGDASNLNFHDTSIKLCESCYNEIKHNGHSH